MRRLALVLAVVLTGCGADSPTAPTAPTLQIPDVAGTYTGPLTLLAVTAMTTLQGSARFDVAQAGAQLTISGSITFLGETVQLPAPITGTINATGFFTPTSGWVEEVNDPDCGRVTSTSASITFSGRTMRLVETASTDFCGNFELSGSLNR